MLFVSNEQLGLLEDLEILVITKQSIGSVGPTQEMFGNQYPSCDLQSTFCRLVKADRYRS